MADTIKASVITDHAFEPSRDNPYLCGWLRNPLLKPCRMAEAAHRETTIKREHVPSMVTLCKGEHPWNRETTIERNP